MRIGALSFSSLRLSNRPFSTCTIRRRGLQAANETGVKIDNNDADDDGNGLRDEDEEVNVGERVEANASSEGGHEKASMRTSLKADNFSQIREELLARPVNVFEDYLSPTNSKRLTQALATYLPLSSQRAPYGIEIRDDRYHDNFIPQGHHLVYFPTREPSSRLLPDGTDTLHFPGEPFVRRMWAGGSVQFNPSLDHSLRSTYKDTRRAVCTEGIRDVRIKGPLNEEKIFVDIERQYRQKGIPELPQTMDAPQQIARFLRDDPASIIEKRTLVFMRAAATGEKGMQKDSQRFVKSPVLPEFNMQIVPRPRLLRIFSGLSSNKHKIHLSTRYAYKIEGHRSMIVHGPLTLVLMLSLLRGQLEDQEMVSSLNYRNLAPLYVNEMMNVCGKRKPDGSFVMWIEDDRGSLAVKAEAEVAWVSTSERENSELSKKTKKIRGTEGSKLKKTPSGALKLKDYISEEPLKKRSSNIHLKQTTSSFLIGEPAREEPVQEGMERKIRVDKVRKYDRQTSLRTTNASKFQPIEEPAQQSSRINLLQDLVPRKRTMSVRRVGMCSIRKVGTTRARKVKTKKASVVRTTRVRVRRTKTKKASGVVSSRTESRRPRSIMKRRPRSIRNKFAKTMVDGKLKVYYIPQSFLPPPRIRQNPLRAAMIARKSGEETREEDLKVIDGLLDIFDKDKTKG